MSNETTDDELIDYGPSKSLPPLKTNPHSLLWLLTSVLAIGLSLYIMFYAFTRYDHRGPHTVISLGWGLIVYTLTYHLTEEGGRWETIVSKVVSAAAIGLILYITYYFFVTYGDLQGRVLQYSDIEYLLGGLLILIVIIATRRAFGIFLTFIVVLGLGYGYFGYSLPWWFNHSGVGIERIIEINVLTLTGAYGYIPQVGSTWVAIFLIYAGLLEGYGALNFAYSIGKAVEQRIRGGAAQSAVLASLFMGSISGSAVANTAATGAFTIPFMKDRGFKSETAAGIESTASSGGQVVPPVMGAAAFVMAGILNISYLAIITVALLPAILFYFTLSLSTHLLWLKQGATDSTVKIAEVNESGSSIGDFLAGVKIGLPLLFSLVVLIYYLAVLRYDPMSSGLRAIVAVIVAQMVWRFHLSGFDPASLRETTRDTLQGLQIGASILAPIFVVLAAIGILEVMINVGDITRLLTFAMIDVSGGSLIVLLLLAMIMSLLFGLGMPTVAAYVLVAIFVGPAVVEFGVEQLHAHMFVFYFAILSAITPPVALTCVVACRIADAGFLGTCKEALRVSAPAFMLPFAFVIHPELLQWGTMSPVVFGMIAVAILGVAISTSGYLFGRVSYVHRSASVISGVAIIFTNSPMVNAAGVVLILLITIINYPMTQERVSAVLSSSK